MILHISDMKKLMEKIFAELDRAVEQENEQRLKDGTSTIPKSEVLILGQMSLMLNESVTKTLNLIQTGDMDARLRMDNFTKSKLLDLLKANGLVYDEDSHLVWMPEDAKLINWLKLKNLEVMLFDAESVLLSKAVHAPEKNRQLIRQAILSGHFPNLVDRIILNGGKLEIFLEGEHE